MTWGTRSHAIGWAAFVLGCAVAATWLATDALERENDFCNACHIEGDVPLHIDIRRQLDARPPRSLAARHAVRMRSARPEDPVMRCFDCHGGVGLTGRVRVKGLAARDLVVWLAGRGREPESLRVPLRDEDCRRCHARFPPSDDDRAGTPFHALDVHNHDFDVTCATCHVVHEDEVDAGFHFLATQRVREQCARCHGQFES